MESLNKTAKALGTGLIVKQSVIPLEALYNPQIEKFKKAELESGLDPTPLTLLILRNKRENKVEYRLMNEERGVKLDVGQNPDNGPQNPIINSPLGGVNIHKTNKAVWIQHDSQDNRIKQQMIQSLSPTMKRTITKRISVMMSLEFSKTQIKKPSQVKAQQKQSPRFVDMMKDFLSKTGDQENFKGPQQQARLETIKEEVTENFKMRIQEPVAEIITSDATLPGQPPIDEKEKAISNMKKRSPFRKNVKHLEVFTDSEIQEGSPKAINSPQSSYEFKDETALQRYIAHKTYGRSYGVNPSKWGVLYAETIKGGRYKIEDSSPIVHNDIQQAGDAKIILHNKKEASALSPKLPEI